MNNRLGFTIKKRKKFVEITAACVLIFVTSLNSFAQYKGAPVKKDRLVKALRSKQLQTRDIVTVISSNGVDFALTPETKKILIAAGARPEVIKAVADNPRFLPNASSTIAKNPKPPIPIKPPAPNYDDLLEQAIISYRDKKNPKGAVGFLEAAMKLNPKNPAAFQMLGFVNLYGLHNLPAAEKLMRQSITNGGSAVFRVYHDDTGGFSGRCTGSLYISPESIR